jgi:hypothetical protein
MARKAKGSDIEIGIERIEAPNLAERSEIVVARYELCNVARIVSNSLQYSNHSTTTADLRLSSSVYFRKLFKLFRAASEARELPC